MGTQQGNIVHVKGHWRIRGKGQTGRETERVKQNKDYAAVQKRRRRGGQNGKEGTGK